jgi:copper chaperone
METELLKVTGMTCGGCLTNITHALKAVPGVDEVMVSLPAGEVMVQYDERMATSEQLQMAVKDAGYGVDSTTLA